jgi:hypothetical protein
MGWEKDLPRSPSPFAAEMARIEFYAQAALLKK